MLIATEKLIESALYALSFLGVKEFLLLKLKCFYLQARAESQKQSFAEEDGNGSILEQSKECVWKHPLISTLFLIFFGASPLCSNSRLEAFINALFIGQLFFLAWIDAATGYLPNFLNYLLLLSGLLTRSLNAASLASLGFIFLEVLIAGGFLWGLKKLALLLQAGEQIGSGDLLFFAALGAWLGAVASFQALLLAALLALFVCAFTAQRRVRYAPYLAFSGALLFYAQSFDWVY